MENRLVAIDPTEELATRATLPVNTAKELQVNSQASLEVAGDIVRILKDLQDEVNKVFEPLVKQAHLAHKAVKNAQNEHLAPLQEAEASLRVKMNTWLRTQEVERLAAIAARQKAEDNLKQQPAIRKPPGYTQMVLKALFVEPPKLPEVPAPAKAEGMHTVEDWKWKVVDVAAIPAEYWVLDEDLITKRVNHSKGETNIPGIEVWSEKRAVIKR